MTAQQDPPKLTLDEFEATARDITYQWMQHVGHGHEDVEFYERLLDEDTPVDEGDPNHDALRELEDTSEMVVFVMERLANLPLVGVPVVARDEASGEGDDLTVAYMVGLEEGKDWARDEAEELRAALRTLVTDLEDLMEESHVQLYDGNGALVDTSWGKLLQGGKDEYLSNWNEAKRLSLCKA